MNTANQERIFAIIRDRIDGTGFAPTIAEIAEQAGLGSGTVNSIIEALIRQKRVTKTTARSRNLAISATVDLTSIGTEAMRAELARRGVNFDALDRPRLSGARACAANRCTSSVQPGMLMCRLHWFRLPKHKRDTIMAAWAGRHVQAYRDAVAEAIDFLDGHGWPSSQREAG